MMVDRRCPTCISLATLGEEKSTTALLYLKGGAHVPMPCTVTELSNARSSELSSASVQPVHSRLHSCHLTQGPKMGSTRGTPAEVPGLSAVRTKYQREA